MPNYYRLSRCGFCKEMVLYTEVGTRRLCSKFYLLCYNKVKYALAIFGAELLCGPRSYHVTRLSMP